jgi:glycerol-3-phosphate acyltransferase PlsY
MDEQLLLGILVIVTGYLSGSIPFAYLITRRLGIDVFQVGTGNPGAANIFRMVGRKWGAIVFLTDFSKGALPVTIGTLAQVDMAWVVACGVAAVIGHWFPIFLKFKGGAGLATGAGAILIMSPVIGLATIVAGVPLIKIFRDTGVGAGVAGAGFIVVNVLAGTNDIAIGSCVIGGLVLLRWFVVTFVVSSRT